MMIVGNKNAVDVDQNEVSVSLNAIKMSHVVTCNQLLLETTNDGKSQVVSNHKSGCSSCACAEIYTPQSSRFKNADSHRFQNLIFAFIIKLYFSDGYWW